jgi:hypothetical protein
VAEIRLSDGKKLTEQDIHNLVTDFFALHCFLRICALRSPGPWVTGLAQITLDSMGFHLSREQEEGIEAGVRRAMKTLEGSDA